MIILICFSVLGFILFTFFSLGIYKKTNKRLISLIDQQKEYIDQAEFYIEHQNQVLNEWSDEYNALVLKNNEYVDLLEEYLQIGDYSKPKFDCIKEIDDLLIKLTTKEFIRHMAWKKIAELKATNKVITLDKLEVGDSIGNLNKDEMYRYRGNFYTKHFINRKFSFRKESENSYRLWRIK